MVLTLTFPRLFPFARGSGPSCPKSPLFNFPGLVSSADCFSDLDPVFSTRDTCDRRAPHLLDNCNRPYDAVGRLRPEEALAIMMQAQAPRYAGTNSQHHRQQHGADYSHSQSSPPYSISRRNTETRDPAESDDGGHHSGDGEDLDHDDENDETRLGKRKRPISVS